MFGKSKDKKALKKPEKQSVNNVQETMKNNAKPIKNDAPKGTENNIEKKVQDKKPPKLKLKSWYSNRYQMVVVQRNILLLFLIYFNNDYQYD